jgi:hypothetical protein
VQETKRQCFVFLLSLGSDFLRFFYFFDLDEQLIYGFAALFQLIDVVNRIHLSRRLAEEADGFGRWVDDIDTFLIMLNISREKW